MKKPALITDPVGIDRVIQHCQEYLITNLPNIECVFGRAFKNENRNGKFIPEVFWSNNEYFEVLTNDTLNSHIFFDVEQKRDAEYRGNTQNTYDLNTTIRIIVSANLKKTYPDKAHRASEELINDILTVMDVYSSKYANWRLNSVIEGTNNVLSNYNYELPESKSNMHPFYLVAFEYDIKYFNKLC